MLYVEDDGLEGSWDRRLLGFEIDDGFSTIVFKDCEPVSLGLDNVDAPCEGFVGMLRARSHSLCAIGFECLSGRAG